MSSTRPPTLSWRSLERLAAPLTVLVCGALLAWVQFSFDGLYDGDSYFHTRAAREIARHGIHRDFPQATVSTWQDRYSDKDLGYHLLLIPFQLQHLVRHPSEVDAEDLVTPGKEAVVFFDLLLLSAFAWALFRVGARFGAVWLLLLFSTNVSVMGHLLAARPHVLGIAFLAVEAALLLRRSVLALGILGLAHVLAHSSFVLLPALALSMAGVCLVRREPVPWRSLAAVLGGLVAGQLLNPYFPNNLSVAWDQTVEVARNLWGGSPAIPGDLFGGELKPATTKDLLACFAGWAPAALGLAATLAAKRPRALSTEALALIAMNAVLGVLSFLSAQFIVFWIPLAILLAARVWTELAEDRSLPELWAEHRRGLLLGAGLVLACLAGGQATSSVARLRHKAQETYTRSAEQPAVEFLRRNAAPGEVVYHNFWWDFSVLYHFRPDGRYIVGLDPVFMYRKDPERFAEMLRAYRGEAANVYDVVAGRFGARWVYVSRSSMSPPFLALLHNDPRFERVYADRNAEVYRVRPGT